jgi:hypothetical protein
MYPRIAPPRLGQNIVVVMDSVPGFLDALRNVVSRLPQIECTLFTLLCCHPMHYWEHGGVDNPEARQELEKAWKAEDEEFDLAEHCLNQARAILHDAGVPDSHIFTKTLTDEDSITAATMGELRQGQYSGVIVGRSHEDIVNRLLRKGITDAFRQIPKVEVLTLDLEQRIGKPEAF